MAHRWSGQAMGAHASMVVNGLDRDKFDRLSAVVSAEIDRLENIFSLYRLDSDLKRLNEAGRLDDPSFEFVELLSIAGSIHRVTDGAFDPTIQPLWDLHARSGGKPPRGAIAALRSRIGWHKVDFDNREIAFASPGMALTLNGIAQGYVTDRIARLLRQHGLNDVLVSIGEIAARGTRAPGQAWRIGISETADGTPEETVSLKDQAIATSAPSGTVFDAAGTIGHILDPRSGKPTARWRRISVINPSAAVADGLSTAFCIMRETGIAQTIARVPDCRVIAMDFAGKRLTSGS
jgi:thiamine biosynthesis lipoprotein